MRESGYLSQLQQLIYHPEESVQITALVALGNLALNKNNSKELKVRLALHVSFFFNMTNFILYGNIFVICMIKY